LAVVVGRLELFNLRIQMRKDAMQLLLSVLNIPNKRDFQIYMQQTPGKTEQSSILLHSNQLSCWKLYNLGSICMFMISLFIHYLAKHSFD